MKSYYLETYGCQMNFSDSLLIENLLREQGIAPAVSMDEADLILVNTCGVRENAETRVIGRLGAFKARKDSHPETLIAVCGCMAQRMGETIIEKAPWVDAVIGPDNYRRIPAIIKGLSDSRAGKVLDLAFDKHETYSDLDLGFDGAVSAYVPITRGCDNFCTYCIVPYVRGRERSVPAAEVIVQLKKALETGAKEIVLLGQNVNSYEAEDCDSFAKLLQQIDKTVEGDFWLRFLTSHPRDLGEEVIRAMAESKRVCANLHLPVQSGSSAVLNKMHRGYDSAYYRRRVKKLRELIPGISLTTDILVGFPGESEENFRETVSLMNDVRFDYAFTFRYSPRPGTVAANWPDDVSEERKISRLQEVIEIQRGHTREALDRLDGKVIEVLIAKPARHGEEMYSARTALHFDAFLTADQSMIGAFRKARITGNTGMQLFAELC